MTISLPRQLALTHRFSLGRPRDFTIAPGGQRIVFLRSRGGRDPVNCLWVHDGGERLLVDPGDLEGADEELSEPERVRRERTRETAAGITAYSTDGAVSRAVFALSGRLWLADLHSGQAAELPVAAPAEQPRIDASGETVAYVSRGALRVIGADGSGDRALAEPEGAEVTYGLPEHVAGESMSRYEGYWWAPDGAALLVSRVDNTPVRRWHISDPANPESKPREVAYPMAGTANAIVTLEIIGVDGRRVPVTWDREAFEYLTGAVWGGSGLVIAVQSRDQRTLRVLDVDAATGATATRCENTDEHWTAIVPGLPALTASGALVWTVDADDTRRLVVDGEAVTPPGLQLRRVWGVDGESVTFTASTEPTEIGLWSYAPGEGPRRLSGQPLVLSAQRVDGTTVVTSISDESHIQRVAIHCEGQPEIPLASHAEAPVVRPRVTLRRGGERDLRTAVLFPTGHRPGSRRLPVLMDPYGGPAGQKVLAAGAGYLPAQWFADQGFAVVIVDGRGTPGRGPAWERAIHGMNKSLSLPDQVDGLHAVAERYPDDIDLGRVGIRGWSYGGTLAAMAVLREPEVFHVAVAGAPVTDMAMYDTHWMERFLGHPDDQPEAYRRAGLIDDAPRLRRPLLLVHGLADDNVVVAHTLRLSAALTAAGRAHSVLPLSGITHMAGSRADVAENLMLLELGFVKNALHMTD
ncbi:MAG TPA: prolyl oligopeptidase family serine peptidase [Stackebrandtia sp.]|uniref:S9 family peptidase n=1 Tax=Stackebrandtia sp. TaxID=2023065 RepID=UPI002D46C246|nr:prolyl oligopeptidase family serine peptidase [Stackebrandtia sp.]HZE41479.1 prolyl oligopeptidase family serine peptidase [Stackebrandtia sp.]